MEHRQFVTTRIYGYVPLLVPLVATGVQGRLLAPSAVPATHLSRDILTSLDHPVPAEGGLFVAICGLLRRREMQRVMLMTIILAFGMIGARAEGAGCPVFVLLHFGNQSGVDSRQRGWACSDLCWIWPFKRRGGEERLGILLTHQL